MTRQTFACMPLLAFALGLVGVAQSAPPAQAPAANPAMPTAQDRAAIMAASAAERDRELKILGITATQPPLSAYDIGKPGNANYDESKANPYPKLPALLRMNDGTPVKTPAQWQKRRAEIAAMFSREVYGRYPAHIPAVTWRVDSTEQMTVAGVPAIVKHVVGHVDNAGDPEITVDIHADVVTPASAKGRPSRSLLAEGRCIRSSFIRRRRGPGRWCT